MRHQPMSDVRGWRQETHIRLKADDSGSKVLLRRMDFSKQFQFKDLDLLARIFSSLTDNIEPRLHSGNPPTATLMRESPFSLHKAAPMIISDSKNLQKPSLVNRGHETLLTGCFGLFGE
jgi:hypothetical protein